MPQRGDTSYFLRILRATKCEKLNETGILMATLSHTAEAMTRAWGAKARGRMRHPEPIFFRPLTIKGALCALTGRAVFLFRGNVHSHAWHFPGMVSSVIAQARDAASRVHLP